MRFQIQRSSEAYDVFANASMTGSLKVVLTRQP
jgi:hypothetical protein